MCVIHWVCGLSLPCHTHAHSHSHAHTQDLFLETGNIHYTERQGSQQKWGLSTFHNIYHKHFAPGITLRKKVRKRKGKEEGVKKKMR